MSEEEGRVVLTDDQKLMLLAWWRLRAVGLDKITFTAPRGGVSFAPITPRDA